MLELIGDKCIRIPYPINFIEIRRNNTDMYRYVIFFPGSTSNNQKSATSQKRRHEHKFLNGSMYRFPSYFPGKDCLTLYVAAVFPDN